MSERPIKICFVSVQSYPVINPQASGLFGGMETLAWEFARQLAALPTTDISFVVTHREAPRTSRVDGVEIVEATDLAEWYRQDVSEALHSWKESNRLPWTRLPTLAAKLAAYAVTRPFRCKPAMRWATTSKWLTRIDANVYLAFGVNTQAEWAAISAFAIGRPFVLCLMSDFDIDRRYLDNPDYVNQYGVTSAIARRLIRESNGIVAQTPLQQRQLKHVWQRDSVLVSNPLDLSAWDRAMAGPPIAETPQGPFVLWVGRADRFHKRPLEMLRAVKANPEIQFVMVLNPSDEDVLKQVTEANCKNLTIIPKVSARQMAALMRAATVFVTTGSAAFEGLPSVLMEAAAMRTPIVSLEAAPEWLDASGAGICNNGDFQAFEQTIARFVIERDSPVIRRYAEAGRRYVESEHSADKQAAKLLAYLRHMIETAGPCP